MYNNSVRAGFLRVVQQRRDEISTIHIINKSFNKSDRLLCAIHTRVLTTAADARKEPVRRRDGPRVMNINETYIGMKRSIIVVCV